MTTALSDNDIKVLNYEKRMGYVFLILIYSFGAFFNLAFFVLVRDKSYYLTAVLVDCGIISLGIFVFFLTNKNLNFDLKEIKKEHLKRRVDKKIEEKSYEAGSGTLFIPVLGNLFPKLWGQGMRESKRYYFESNGYKHEVDKDLYNELKKGSDYIIHFARHSSTTLCISKDE